MKTNLKSMAVLWAVVVAGTAAAAVVDTLAPDRCGTFKTTTVTRSAVTLSWVSPKEDVDNVVPDNSTITAAALVQPHLNVSPTPTTSPSGPCTSYDIRYSTTPITDSNWALATPAVGEPAPASVGTTQTFTVTGLAANQRYYFAIKGIDEAGNQGLMATANVMTAADTVEPATVTGLVVSDAGDNYITLSWSAPADDDGGKVASYDLRYAMGSLDASTWDSATPVVGEPEPQAPGSPEFVTLNDLGDGTYAFAVIAYDVAGNKSAVPVAVTQTLTGRVSGPEDSNSGCGQSAPGSAPALLAALVLAAILLRR